MLYNMYFVNNSYLCIVNKTRKRCITSLPRAEGVKLNDYEKEC